MSLVRFTERGDFKPIKRWSAPEVYESWLALLPRGEYERIVQAMNARIDRMDVVRAQYVVCKGPDEWYEEYEPIYYAVAENHEAAGKFVGLILWDVMNQRLDNWAFHKIDKTIVSEYNTVEDIQVMEYFRAENFPRTGRWRDELPDTDGGSEGGGLAEALKRAWGKK
jgi:hypothetical protein